MISEQLHKDAIRFKEWHEGRAAQAKNCATFNVTPALQEIAAGHEKVAATIAALLDALPQPAPSPQAPGRRKGPPGITLEPHGHEQPAAPVVSDERLLREWDRVSHITEAGSRRLAFARAILAMRPAVEPMTDEQIDDAINALGERDAHQACKLSFEFGVRAAEAHRGITAKAEGGA